MRWRGLGWLAGAVIVVVAGTAVYAWGAGWFWPCETLGRLVSQGRCVQLLTFEDRQVGTFAALPNGNLLVATMGEGRDPVDPLALVEVDPATGAIVAETPLPSIPPDARPSTIAISGDGSQVALSLYQEKTRVLTRDGAELLALNRWVPAYLAFDDKGWLLLDMGRNPGGLPRPELAEAWAIDGDGSAPVPATPADTSVLFEEGMNIALSPDGTVFAQKIDQLRDSAVTGIRVGSVDRTSEAGLLLGTTLRADCGYFVSQISFSPFGSRVAAEFSCPERWGQVSTALVVWDYEAGTTLLTLPGIDYFATLLWLDAGTLVVDRYNYDPETTDLLRIAVPDAE